MVRDAGCGPGLVAEAFLRDGHRIVGVDLSAKMTARARDKTHTTNFTPGAIVDLLAAAGLKSIRLARGRAVHARFRRMV